MNTHNIVYAVYTTANTDPGAPVQATRTNGDLETRRNNDDVDGGGMLAFLAGGGAIAPYVEPYATSADVTAERDRRIAGGFIFGGNEYQTDQGSRENIGGALGLSIGAMIADPTGSLGLRWADPDLDFAWIDSANNERLMTAAECQAFCQSAMQYKMDLIKSARVIKDSNPIPENYADDIHWPSRTLD